MNNYSILLWDVGTGGSFLLCVSDMLRNNIPITVDNLKKYERNDGNEYMHGINNDMAYWYNTRLDTFETLKNTILKEQKEHIKCHWIKNSDVDDFFNAALNAGYKNLIRLQSNTYKNYALMYSKRSINAPSRKEYTHYPIDKNRCISQSITASKYGISVDEYDYEAVFSDFDTFATVITQLSGGISPDISVWEIVQDYNHKNEAILSSIPETCEYYKEYISNSGSIVEQLYQVDDRLLKFLDECERKGYYNNNTLESLKFDWCLDIGGAWFATVKNNKIISLSGIHPWANGWRALFRGVQLEARPIGLNRHHMQSYPFYSHLPQQIKFAFNNNIDIHNDFVYITTNTETDSSGKMTRINKTFYHLEKLGLVKNLGEHDVYNVKQNTWILNIENYNNIRGSYDIKNKWDNG